MQQKDSFSREDTRIMKGAAIILMLMHHLWAYPERLYRGREFKGLLSLYAAPLIEILGRFGKICVPLFFFLGGYGLYVSSQGHSLNLIGRLKGLYRAYWRVFFVFVPIALLFFRHQSSYTANAMICHRYASTSGVDFVRCALGLSTAYNGEWWFLAAYICALITFPLARQLFERHSAGVNFLLLALAELLTLYILPALGDVSWLGEMNRNSSLYTTFFAYPAGFIVSFWAGIAAGKDDLLVRLRESLHKNGLLNPLADLLILTAILWMRELCGFRDEDFLLVPFLITAVVDLAHRLHPLRALLTWFGAASTTIWLTHTFYCYYFEPTARLLSAVHWALPALILLLLLSRGTAYLLDFFWAGVEKLTAPLFSRLQAQTASNTVPPAEDNGTTENREVTAAPAMEISPISPVQPLQATEQQPKE